MASMHQERPILIACWRRMTLRAMFIGRHAADLAVCAAMEEKATTTRTEQCDHRQVYIRTHSNRYAKQEICDPKLGGCGCIVKYEPSELAIHNRESKSKNKPTVITTMKERAAKDTSEGKKKNPALVCPRCLTPQTIWNGGAEPVYRCGNWPECKVLGAKVVTNTVITNTVEKGPIRTTHSEAPSRASGSASKPQVFDMTAADQMLLMQQQMAALQQQIGAMSQVNEMGSAPPGYRPAPRRRKATASEVMVIDSGDEF